MEQTELWLVISLIILLVIMCIYYSKCKRRFTKLFVGAISGALLLFPAQWILTAMGATFSVNVFTASVSVILGMPGVLLLAVSCFL